MSVDFTLNYDLNIDFMFLMGFNQRLKGNGVLRQKATEIEQPVLIQLLPEKVIFPRMKTEDDHNKEMVVHREIKNRNIGKCNMLGAHEYFSLQ